MTANEASDLSLMPQPDALLRLPRLSLERIDALNMGAVVTEQGDTIRLFADFVHRSSLHSLLYRKCAELDRHPCHNTMRRCGTPIKCGLPQKQRKAVRYDT